jgi:hypothetical protein
MFEEHLAGNCRLVVKPVRPSSTDNTKEVAVTSDVRSQNCKVILSLRASSLTDTSAIQLTAEDRLDAFLESGLF